MNIAQIVMGVQKAHRGSATRFCGCNWRPTDADIEKGREVYGWDRHVHDLHVAERIENALTRHGFYNLHDITFLGGAYVGKFDANGQGMYLCPYPWCDYSTGVGQRGGHRINEALRQHLRDKDHG